MAEQLSMFDVPSTEREKDSIVRVPQAPKRPLTKAQQLFKKRVGRVELLRTQLEFDTLRLDAGLAYFGEHIHPRLQRITGLRKDLTRALAPYLNDKRLKGNNRKKTLRKILADQLDQVIGAEGSLEDTELLELFERIHKVSFEQARTEDAEAARLEMESMLEDFGIEVDLSGFGPGMNQESLAARFEEVTGQIKDQFDQRRLRASKNRRMSPKQIEKERRLQMAEELRKKSIAGVYRQLARALHPDLEPDAELRQRKTVLMQELTVAYRNNDLHTLLRLEIEWIERERGDLDRLSDEKLAVYNDVLKEQADELTAEIKALPYHPRYAPLIVMEEPFGEIVLEIRGNAEALELDQLIAQMEQSLACLRTDEAFKEVLAVVDEYRRMARN
jgi:hypothetical protein